MGRFYYFSHKAFISSVLEIRINSTYTCLFVSFVFTNLSHIFRVCDNNLIYLYLHLYNSYTKGSVCFFLTFVEFSLLLYIFHQMTKKKVYSLLRVIIHYYRFTTINFFVLYLFFRLKLLFYYILVSFVFNSSESFLFQHSSFYILFPIYVFLVVILVSHQILSFLVTFFGIDNFLSLTGLPQSFFICR